MGNVSFTKFLTLLMMIIAVTLQQAEPTSGFTGGILDAVFGRFDRDPKTTNCSVVGESCSAKTDCCKLHTVCAKVNDDTSNKTCNNLPAPTCSIYGGPCSTDKDCCAPPLQCIEANGDATNKTCGYIIPPFTYNTADIYASHG